MSNKDYDVEGKWTEFVRKLDERAPERYENRKTYDGDPRGNYNVPGNFNKLAPGETPTDYYSQEEVGGPNALGAVGGERDSFGYLGNNPEDEYSHMTGDYDGKDHFEVERALRDAMDALGQADPAEVYEKLIALRDMIDTMPAP